MMQQTNNKRVFVTHYLANMQEGIVVQTASLPYIVHC